MRLSIRSQLGLLILTSALIGMAVLAVATWISNHNFVLDIRSSRLSLTASLKAAQLASSLNLMQTSANFVANRIVLQSALGRYDREGNNSEANWVKAQADLDAAIGGSGSVGQALLLQSKVYARDASGPAGINPVLNATADSLAGQTFLPYACPNGSLPVFGGWGGNDCGFPPALYPNLTFSQVYYNSTFNTTIATFNGRTIRPDNGLLLGPYPVNDSLSIVSLTLPVINNTSAADILGWITVLMDARLMLNVLDATEGLGDTGQTLLVGPASSTNTFPQGIIHGEEPVNDFQEDFEVRYVVPLNISNSTRHPDHVVGSANPPFKAKRYPAVVDAITQKHSHADNSDSLIKTHNEDHKQVSVGYAMPQSDLVDWVVLVEQTRSEVWKPINRLRDVLLACVFATAALMAIIAFPLAHFFSLPIRRLRSATAKSIEPPGTTPSRTSLASFDSARDGANDEHEEADGDFTIVDPVLANKEGLKNPISQWRRRKEEEREAKRDARRKRAFKIPGKVTERKSCIKDELTDLTSTFNEMSDELMMQYERLEEKVQQRTAELSLSKRAAEAANESKTLFIANISHELKTPLNGIMGMCAVCMQEDDPVRLKRSLGIIYKSGDLLLNLLTDLLTFSKNQVGQHLSLDEKEFRLRDVSSQVLAIFDKQAKESQIDLRICFEGVRSMEGEESQDLGPLNTGRVKDMILWGDQHRILQVVINLVSNALKFTPQGGSLTVTIRCLPEIPDIASRKGSFASRQSKQQSSRHKNSDASLAISTIHTANAINAKDRPLAAGFSRQGAPGSDRAPSPPPGKHLYFEFEVQDTGPGIPENLQQRIFEPFVQGDLGLSKKYGGTGLGLSICSQLASLMRGSIAVRSQVGQGSTFSMKIPLKHLQSRADSTASSSVDLARAARRSQSIEDGQRTPSVKSRHMDAGPGTPPESSHTPVSPSNLGKDPQPRLVGLSQPFFASNQPLESPGSQPGAMERITAEATRGEKIRVLVAEDNKVNQEVVLRMLKLEDIYDVTVAKDGQEALDRVRETMEGHDSRPFNLIFMDVQMPNVDGLESTRLIREIGYNAPIVALTAFAEESNIKDCMDSGMNYFLSKPIRRPQLKKVLKEYCAPIPEENEDIVSSEDRTAPRRGSGSQNTTIVMVNSSEPFDSQSAGLSKNEPPRFALSGEHGNVFDGPSDINEGSRPVSPLSTA
ncbi:putative histidine kinase HHK5p [Hortaea werneckii]|nr:putative histidine kinase HHK5p [Hortaea werneckii]